MGTANIGQKGPGYTTLESVRGSEYLSPLYVGYYQVGSSTVLSTVLSSLLSSVQSTVLSTVLSSVQCTVLSTVLSSVLSSVQSSVLCTVYSQVTCLYRTGTTSRCQLLGPNRWVKTVVPHLMSGQRKIR